MRPRARDSGTKFARCAAILVYCSVRDWTRFCYVIGFENIRIHPSTCYRIRCRFILFHSGERIEKYSDSLPNSPDACGRKPYPERKSCGFKNIRIRVHGPYGAPGPSIPRGLWLKVNLKSFARRREVGVSRRAPAWRP